MAEAAGPSAAGSSGANTMADNEHFVDKHKFELIKRVSKVAPILDELLREDVIQQESYDKIRTLPTSQEKMRELLSGPLRFRGVQGKDILYKILNRNEPDLIEDLKRTKVETMTIKRMVFETLKDLTSEEFEEFKSLIELEKVFPPNSRKVTNTQDLVELMVETHSQECVELTKNIFKKMNRTDLVQRLSDIRSGTKEKHSVDEQQPSLIQKVETMVSVIELLLETLKDLSDKELKKFKEVLRQIHIFRYDSDIPLMLLNSTDVQDTVFSMVQTFGQQSVEKIKEVLKEMSRTDLVQRLSDSSSGPKKKQSVDERLSALIRKVARMVVVKEQLFETLSDLSYEERKSFKWFLQFTFFQRRLPNTTLSRLQWAKSKAEVVDLMVESCGQQSVEMTREVFMDMNRTDLVQKLSETSSGPKEKHSVDEHWPALNQKVETMVSVIELLLETLKDLSDTELEGFKEVLSQIHVVRYYSDIPMMLLNSTDVQDKVFSMVQTFGQQSVEKTEEVLKRMKRTDLVERLSDSSPGPKKKQSADEVYSALIQRVATIAAVKHLLLETLNDLSNEELEKFRLDLQVIVKEKDLPNISWILRHTAEKEEIVDQMVQTYGQQSVELTREVYMNMNRTDLIQRLSKPSSGLKDKHFEDERRPSPFHRAAVKQIISETLSDLSHKELLKFKCLQQFTFFQRSLPQIPRTQVEVDQKTSIVVDLLVQTCGQQSVDVTKEVFMDMNRVDLVQRLSETSSRVKEKHRSKTVQKDVTMTSLLVNLLETLEDLSYGELEKFKRVLQYIEMKDNLPRIPRHLMETTDIVEIVELMVEYYGEQSVEVTGDVLKKMNKRDLVQRLSDISSGSKAAGPSAGSSGTRADVRCMWDEKHSVDERLPAAIHKVATLAVVKEQLLETLKDLSYEEQKNFKWILLYTLFERSHPDICSELQWANSADELVDMMVESCGQQSVEVTREVFKDMNRTDLVQKLSETSSGPKEKHSVDEHWPALIQKVETMVSVIELLLETLKDLCDTELERFKMVLRGIHIARYYSDITLMLLNSTDVQDTVFLLVQTFGQQSVERIKEVFKRMKRTDLVDRLSDSSPGPKKKHSTDELHSALIQRVATIAAVKQLLLETLDDLSNKEVKKFRQFLQFIVKEKDLRDISWMLRRTAERAQIVDQMVQTYGRQSVELTREVYMKMNKTDLIQRLSKPSSELKEKLGPALSERDVVMTSLHENLLETLKDLSDGELEKFKHVLQYTKMKDDLPRITRDQMETADRVEIVMLMVENYGEQSVEVTREVLKKMNRSDLVQRLSDISSGSKGPSRSLKLEACGSMMQDSSDWTKLEPEVSRTDADEAPTYSLQSEAGNFECNISGFRWVCKEKVSFKYQFRSGEEPVERIKSVKYMPAGPLMDIKIIAGKFDEVYLPHWICIDDNPAIKDKFAVLHIEEYGDFVEKVSEVTPSHVKLSEPHFSLKMVLVKADVPVKTKCMVLIYKTNTAFLTLHVYLIPHDPGLQQAIDTRQLSYGYKVIRKPYPDKSLKMRDRFVLTADLDSAKICPENLKLRYDNKDPNFFEVYIENPDRHFTLNLAQTSETQLVWNREIRKDEYQSTAYTQGQHFVDKHQCDLIKRVSNIGPILDNLLTEGVIQQEGYDTIRAIPTTQEKMRTILSGPLKAGGHAAKDVFYQILENEESYLVDDLKRMEL